MAARSSASLVTRAALSPPTARSVNVPGCAPCSRASRCSGTLVGEVIVVAAPGTKLSPVITPPVLTVTSAVACCHQGFLAERTATLPPFDRYSPFRGVQYEAVVPVCPRGRLPPHGGHRYLAAARLPAGGGQAAQDRLDPRVARVAGVLEERARDVVQLGHHRVLTVDHREGSGALLGEVHHRVRLDRSDQLGECVGVGQIEQAPLDVAAAELTPALDTTLHRGDRDERRRAALEVPAATNEIVNRDDAVALVRQVHRLRPAEIAVRAEHDHRSVAHARSSWGVLTLRPSRRRAFEGVMDWIMPTRSLDWPCQALFGGSRGPEWTHLNRAIHRPGGGQKSDNQLSCRSRVL